MTDIFKVKFGFPKDGFSTPVDLRDTAVGFSVYKDQKDLGRDKFKSIFKVYIKNDDFKKDGDKKPITITASYGKEDEDGNGIITNTTDASDFERRPNWPIDLISKDEFYYDIKTYDFYHNKKIINASEILDLINESHIKPTKLGAGFWLRVKLIFFHNFLAGFFKILFYIISGIQYLLSGEKVNFYLRVETSVAPETKIGKKIKIFDYEVELWIAVIYSIIHLLIYYFLFINNYWPPFFINIFHNGFLTITYTIISLGLTDAILTKIPRVYFTKKPLSYIQEKYYEMASKNIKI